MKLTMTDEERDDLLKNRQAFDYAETRFNFINDHKGLRKKYFHLLMGTAGTGKTTVSRSVLLDLAVSHKVFNYSSEESAEQTKTMFALRGTPNTALENITFFHEDDAERLCDGTIKDWLRILEIKIRNSVCDVFFFDNITTSKFYDSNVKDQPEIIIGLHKILRICDVAGFFVAHTATGVKDDQQALLSASDIRGNRALTNKAEVLYAYQKFTSEASGQSTGPVSYGTIRNLKCRGYDVGNMYLLRFDPAKSEYTGDVRISNLQFREIYDKRFKLGR